MPLPRKLLGHPAGPTTTGTGKSRLLLRSSRNAVISVTGFVYEEHGEKREFPTDNAHGQNSMTEHPFIRVNTKAMTAIIRFTHQRFQQDDIDLDTV